MVAGTRGDCNVCVGCVGCHWKFSGIVPGASCGCDVCVGCTDCDQGFVDCHWGLLMGKGVGFAGGIVIRGIELGKGESRSVSGVVYGMS